MEEWFEIFKAGTHTSSNGLTKTYTDEDLQKIVDNYNNNYPNHEAPIVIGHPKDNDPAYGWIEQLKKVGDRILAKPKQMVKEFADAVKQGLFKKRSISLYPDLTLRHVGFLGAVPPAVKGLADLKFKADDNSTVFEFAEISDDDKEKLINELNNLKSKLREYELSIQKLQEYESNIKKLKDDLNFAEVSKQQAEENLNSLSLKLRKLEFQQYLNERIAYGNLTPAQAEKVAMLLEVLDTIDLKEFNNQRVYEFADGTKANPINLMKDFIELLPQQIKQAPPDANKGIQKQIIPDIELGERIAKSINNN